MSKSDSGAKGALKPALKKTSSSQQKSTTAPDEKGTSSAKARKVKLADARPHRRSETQQGKDSAKSRVRTTRPQPASDETSSEQSVEIDAAKGLVFSSEQELFDFFRPHIQAIENEVASHRKPEDIAAESFGEYEELLGQVIEDPDEIWEEAISVGGIPITSFIGHYLTDQEGDTEGVYYVALAYTVDQSPRFVFSHFPSRNLDLVNNYRRGDLVFDRVIQEVSLGAMEGDALSEGDDLAVGLYKAMLVLRSAQDIKEAQFKDHSDKREPTIEDPDEIWRSHDLNGNTLVSFVKQFDDSAGVWYIAVTVEDTASSSHALLFSFPTNDLQLVDRYRHGENLQAEEVVQEASH